MEAHLTLATIPGDPGSLIEHYRRSAEAMDGVGRDHGLILHAAARADDALLIVNLWPSKDASESAARDARRIQTVKTHGIAPGGISYEHHAVYRYAQFD